jgi:hypothetical protein
MIDVCTKIINMKKHFTLSISLLFVSIFTFSQSTWQYVNAATEGVNTTDDYYANDLHVVSDQEIYTALFVQSVGAASKRIEVRKFNGTSWSTIASPSADETIGYNLFVRPTSTGDIYVAYARYNSQTPGYEVIVKKYNGTSWAQVSTVLPLAGGSSFFDFQVDNNDVPIVLGSKASSISNINISKLESGSWKNYEVLNSSGAIFDYYTSHIDAANNLIFVWARSAFVSGAIAAITSIDTLSGTSLSSVAEEVSLVGSSSIKLLRDGNGSLSIFNYYAIAGVASKQVFRIYNANGNSWTNTSTDTADFNTITAVGLSKDGKGFVAAAIPNLTKLGRAFFTDNLNNYIFEPPINSLTYKIKFSDEYAYVLIKNGVLKIKLSDINPVSAVGELKVSNMDFSIGPNPSLGKFTLFFGDENATVNKKIIISNIVGEVVFEKNTSHTKVDVNIGGAKGIYFVKVETVKGNFSKAVIVE